MTIAEKLKCLREEYGLSQNEIAKRIGVDRTTYVKYESGTSAPTRKLQEIATLFNVSTDFLLGHNEGSVRQSPFFELNPKEIEHIKKYRALDERGKQTVDETLEREYKFANPPKTEKDAG